MTTQAKRPGIEELKAHDLISTMGGIAGRITDWEQFGIAMVTALQTCGTYNEFREITDAAIIVKMFLKDGGTFAEHSLD